MDDFQDAAKRHLDDAELLLMHSSPRLANASHLFGISAECSLKAIGTNHKKPGVSFNPIAGGHIGSQLFAELRNVTNMGASGNLVLKLDTLESAHYFSAWNVSQRYAPQTAFVHATVLQQQAGAKNAYLLMTNCLLGLI
jgi:hypothetical protein